MSTITRTFRIGRARRERGVLLDVAGWTGHWPFRRWISYHVGVNCDAIDAEGGRVYVRRRGWTVAVADYPRPLWPTLMGLLFPRHTSGRPAASANRDWTLR